MSSFPLESMERKEIEEGDKPDSLLEVRGGKS